LQSATLNDVDDVISGAATSVGFDGSVLTASLWKKFLSLQPCFTLGAQAIDLDQIDLPQSCVRILVPWDPAMEAPGFFQSRDDRKHMLKVSVLAALSE
jgi:hypothetical protein